MRQRDSFGDGYVDALRRAYSDCVSPSADLVMYWWVRSAMQIAGETALRSGLITTNSLTQAKNRVHLRNARESGARVIWAAADHPWVEGQDGAAVRVSLTVLAKGISTVRRVEVDDAARITAIVPAVGFNDDLTVGSDLTSASSVPLQANRALSHQGFKVGGAGFRVTADVAEELLAIDPQHGKVVRKLVVGRDVSGGTPHDWVIDFGLMSEEEARGFPVLFDYLRDRVHEERQASKRSSYRDLWWRFQEPRREMRNAITGLDQFIATLEVSKHRFFIRMLSANAPDGTLVVICVSDPSVYGVLSSRLHEAWALAAGSRLGVGNDPRYNKTLCFDAFPFPAATLGQKQRISALAAELEANRDAALSRDDRITITKMYNVIGKLRSNAPLTPAERTIHELAACGILRDLHDDLDKLVAEAYGWPWPMEKEEILERLVALHDERVEEEKHGLIRWLRPEYQIPRFAPDQAPATLALDETRAPEPKHGKSAKAGEAAVEAATARTPWPTTAVEQISSISTLLAQRPLDAADIAASFSGAKLELIQRHLDTLALMGEITLAHDARYHIARRVA